MLDLAHDHTNGGYLPGLACRTHNRQDGAIRRNQARGYTSTPRITTVAARVLTASRQW